MDIVCRLKDVSVFIVSRCDDTEYISDGSGNPLLFGKLSSVRELAEKEITIREVIFSGTINL